MYLSFIPKARRRPSQFRRLGLISSSTCRLPRAAARSPIIETINAPGKGPPRHKHEEAEIFRVLEGRYLYEMDGRRFYAETGDVISIPGGAEHGFVNVTDKPARQYILIAPALDASVVLHRACRGHARRRAGQGRAQPLRRQVASGVSRAAAESRRSAEGVKPLRRSSAAARPKSMTGPRPAPLLRRSRRAE